MTQIVEKFTLEEGFEFLSSLTNAKRKNRGLRISAMQRFVINDYIKNSKSLECYLCGAKASYWSKERASKSAVVELKLYAVTSDNKHCKLTIDHIIPKALGGGNVIENLALACSRCNNERGSEMSLSEILDWTAKPDSWKMQLFRDIQNSLSIHEIVAHAIKEYSEFRIVLSGQQHHRSNRPTITKECRPYTTKYEWGLEQFKSLIATGKLERRPSLNVNSPSKFKIASFLSGRPACKACGALGNHWHAERHPNSHKTMGLDFNLYVKLEDGSEAKLIASGRTPECVVLLCTRCINEYYAQQTEDNELCEQISA